METRDILLKADRIVLALERLEGGKIRALARSWDDAKVISPNQVLEVATASRWGWSESTSRGLISTWTRPVFS